MPDDKWIHAERFAGTEIETTEEFYDVRAAKQAAHPSRSPEGMKERTVQRRARGTHAMQLRISRRSPDAPRGWVTATQRRRDELNAQGKALDHDVPFMHAKIAGLECEANLQELTSRRANHRKNVYEPISDEEAIDHVRAGRACPWPLIDEAGLITGRKQQPIWSALNVLLKLMAEEPGINFQQMTDMARELRGQAESAASPS